MATATTFGVGSGITGTTGTVVVSAGGALNIGVGAGNTFIGGDYINAAGTGRIGQQGTGVLDINGGILTVGGRRQRLSGPGGLDDTALWFNPYGGSGSTINLNGGTLSTARPIQNGSGGSAYFNFNGGTLQAAGNVNVLNSTSITVGVQAGGATIDTNGFNTTVVPASQRRWRRRRTDQDRRGTLTLASAGSTYAGGTTVVSGTLAAAGAGSSTASSLPPGEPITVYAGATLQVNAADALGYYGANPSAINLNGATFTNNGGAFHDTLPAFNLTAGTITAAGAGDAAGPELHFRRHDHDQFRRSASVISTPGTINLRNGQLNNGVANSSVTFNVALGSGPIDLLVASTLGNESGANGLVKNGAGTMLLSNPDTYAAIR